MLLGKQLTRADARLFAASPVLMMRLQQMPSASSNTWTPSSSSSLCPRLLACHAQHSHLPVYTHTHICLQTLTHTHLSKYKQTNIQ